MYNKKWAASRAETKNCFVKMKILLSSKIFFSIPSSIRAAPVAHPRLPIYSYKSILQYIYRKNICISKPSLIVASSFFFSATDIR